MANSLRIRWPFLLILGLATLMCGATSAADDERFPCTIIEHYRGNAKGKGIFVYDEMGRTRLVDVKREHGGKGVFGGFSHRYSLQYDDGGWVQSESGYDDPDGSDPATVYSYSFDKEGRIGTAEVDYGNDGSVDWMVDYEYDAVGRLAATLGVYMGEITEDTTMPLDDEMAKAFRRKELIIPGRDPDPIITKYQYDEQGRVSLIDVRLQYVEHLFYNRRGFLVRSVRTHKRTGSMHTKTVKRTPRGFVRRADFDTDQDGKRDWWIQVRARCPAAIRARIDDQPSRPLY